MCPLGYDIKIKNDSGHTLFSLAGNQQIASKYHREKLFTSNSVILLEPMASLSTFAFATLCVYPFQKKGHWFVTKQKQIM